MQTAKVTHCIGQGQTETGLTLGNLGKGTRVKKPLSVRWGSSSYLIGKTVPWYAEPFEGFSFERLYRGAEARAMTYAVLSKLLEPGDHELEIVAGLPVEPISKDPRGTLAKVRGWLEGEHVFVVDEREYRLSVEKVSIAAQPQAAYFAWGCNDSGEWIKGREGKEALVGILDAGFRTSDFFGVKSGNISTRYTCGSVGVQFAIERIQDNLGMFDLNYSSQEINSMIRDGQDTIEAHVTVDIKDIIRDALDDCANEIISFLRPKIGSGYKFKHLFTVGGGSLLLENRITEAFPTAKQMPNPVFAPAIGLAKLGGDVGLDLGFGAYKAAFRNG